MNRGAGFSLEIPVDYIIYGDCRVTTRLQKTLQKLYNLLNVKIGKGITKKTI